MITFTYTIKDQNGKTIKGMADSVDKEALITQLQRQGYFIISIEEPTKKTLTATPTSTRAKKKTFTHKGISMDDKLIFARQLATMLDSGVNLLRSLNVISQQIESQKFHTILINVRDEVEQGISFSQSLAKYPKVFDELWVSLVEIGEASGTMPMVLSKLAFYIDREQKFRSAIISGLIYPVLLMIISVAAVLVFAFVIGPQFENLYSQFNAELPVLTVAVLGFFKFLTRNIILIILSFCAIVFIARKYCETPKGRLQLEALIFMLPVAGPVVRTMIVEKFTSQMSILVDSGVPIVYAIDIIQRLIGNKTCEAVIKQMKERVREGKLISHEMERTDFFPPMATQMIAVGEETGELGKMLTHISEYYQNYIQTFIHRFSTIFEPLMLIFIGVVIGTLVLAMFLPIFDIASLG